MLDELSSKAKIDRAVEMIEDCIARTCKACLPRYTSAPVRKLPWIDEELKRAKTELKTAYRRWRRSLTDLRAQYNHEEYIKAKKKYKKMFLAKRKSSWRSFCESATAGNAFQVFRAVKPTSKPAFSTIKIDEQNYTHDYADTPQPPDRDSLSE